MGFEVTTMRATVIGIERHCVPRKIIAQCDRCDQQYLGGDVWNTIERNEALLREDGWLTSDGLHICPDCHQF